MAPFKRGDTIYALPWLSDSTVVGYRTDLFEKAGYAKFPETFEALQEAAAKIHTRQTAGFVTEDNLHWIFPNWLLSYGGGFFANPPGDLTPTFDTPEALKAAEMFTTMLAKYSPPGGIKLDPSVAQAIMHQGKGACYLDGMGNTQHIIDTTKTTLADRMAFTHTPRGPKGHFPQLAVHGYFINKASKNKPAAWELLKYLTGRTGMQQWVSLGLALPTRKDVHAVAGRRAFTRYPGFTHGWGNQIGFRHVWNDVANNELTAVIEGKESVDSMLSKIAAAAQ
jgi:multiple sugar transport system substrate-binding protein